jgi:hypothetical protein
MYIYSELEKALGIKSTGNAI